MLYKSFFLAVFMLVVDTGTVGACPAQDSLAQLPDTEQRILTITSEPLSAQVVVNGDLLGYTPFQYIVPGFVRVILLEIKRPHFFPARDTIDLGVEHSDTLHYVLVRSPRLIVKGPETAAVYVNNLDVRTHPKGSWYKEKWALDQIDYGTYSIRVDKQFCPVYETTIELTPEEPVIQVTPDFLAASSTLILTTKEPKARGWIRGENLEQPFRIQRRDTAGVNLTCGKYEIVTWGVNFRYCEDTLVISSNQTYPLQVDPATPPWDVMVSLSHVYPGLGQMFSEQPLKGLLMTGAITWAIPTMIVSHQQYEKELPHYNDVSTSYQLASNQAQLDLTREAYRKSRAKMVRYHRMFLVALSAAIISYTWSIVDIRYFYPEQSSGMDLSLAWDSRARDSGLILRHTWLLDW